MHPSNGRRRTSRPPSTHAHNPPLVNVDTIIIQVVVRQLQELHLSSQTPWDTLKREIVSRTRFIELAKLDEFKSVILDLLSKRDKQMQNDRSFETIQPTSQIPQSDESPRGTPIGEELPRPEINHELTERMPSTLAMWAKGAWQGVCAAFGYGENSYIHSRIVKRLKLKVVNGRVLLTWRLDHQESYRTRLIVYNGSEGKSPDVVFGTKYKDEDDNFDCMTSTRELTPEFDDSSDFLENDSDYDVLGGLILSTYHSIKRKQRKFRQHTSYGERKRIHTSSSRSRSRSTSSASSSSQSSSSKI